MTDRKLVGFDLLPEDIPPIPSESHDWTKETPDMSAMANQNLRVTCEAHPGQFQQVLAFASRTFEKANPGMLAGQTDWEYQGSEPVACTVFPVPAE
jgi:hypothetical protein